MQNLEWLKIKEVLIQTLELPISERDSFLGNHPAFIQSEVRELIKSHEEADNFIAEPAVVELGFSQDINIGQQIDDYKIIARIGEGGMGNVYFAERIGFEQKVALKLIRRGMDTRNVLKRFKQERQILSRLNHPNIAKLLGGGETPEGLPYFAMEYIEGLPINKFCETHFYDINERLELFQKVCDAVGFAHKNLIVHRDLKPSNIIVTNDGTPKLLDFGIAKLLDSETENTGTIGRMFTPEYASPEQINGLPITTATDVYSLGIVLYELLSGVRPFNTKGKSYGEIVDLVLTQEPVRPSSVVNSLWSVVRNTSEIREKTQRETTDQKSKIKNPKSLQGDLDSIILKAIRKEPDHRYQTIGDFSEDIRRHLNGLPVTATADSFGYRFKKFVERNKKGVAIGSLIFSLFLLLSGVATWQAIVANKERARAEKRLMETRKIANSLMFEIHDSLQDLPGATAARELLVKRASESLDKLLQDSDNNPELLRDASISYRKIGDILGNPSFSSLAKLGDALPYYQKAFEIQKKLLESDSENIELLKEFGNTNYVISLFYYQARAETEEALRYCRAAQEIFEEITRKEPSNSDVKHQLAKFYAKSSEILRSMNKLNESDRDTELAIKFIDEAQNLSPQDSNILNMHANLLVSLADRLGNPYFNDQGEPDKSLNLLEKAIAIRQKLIQEEPNNLRYRRSYGSSLQSQGAVYRAKQDFPRAIQSFRKASEVFEELANGDVKDEQMKGYVALNAISFGDTLRASGSKDESLSLLKKTVEYFDGLYRRNPENTGMLISLSLSLEALADTLASKNQHQQALDMYIRSIELMSKLREKNDSYEIVIPIARFYLKAGKIKHLNPNDCKISSNYFYKSYEILEAFKTENRLSPTNTSIYEEAKNFAQNPKCK